MPTRISRNWFPAGIVLFARCCPLFSLGISDFWAWSASCRDSLPSRFCRQRADGGHCRRVGLVPCSWSSPRFMCRLRTASSTRCSATSWRRLVMEGAMSRAGKFSVLSWDGVGVSLGLGGCRDRGNVAPARQPARHRAVLLLCVVHAGNHRMGGEAEPFRFGFLQRGWRHKQHAEWAGPGGRLYVRLDRWGSPRSSTRMASTAISI